MKRLIKQLFGPMYFRLTRAKIFNEHRRPFLNATITQDLEHIEIGEQFIVVDNWRVNILMEEKIANVSGYLVNGDKAVITSVRYV